MCQLFAHQIIYTLIACTKWCPNWFIPSAYLFVFLISECMSLYCFWPFKASSGLHTWSPQEIIQSALSVSQSQPSPWWLNAHRRGQTSQALSHLHKTHQKSSTTQHQTGPQQSKQCPSQSVLLVPDDMVGVVLAVTEAWAVAPQVTVQSSFYFLHFVLKSILVHLTFWNVKTLEKEKKLSEMFYQLV